MYTQEELASKNLPELQQIAKSLSIPKMRAYKKEVLISLIIKESGSEETMVPSHVLAEPEQFNSVENRDSAESVRPKRTRIKREIYSTSSSGTAQILTTSHEQPSFGSKLPEQQPEQNAATDEPSRDWSAPLPAKPVEEREPVKLEIQETYWSSPKKEVEQPQPVQSHSAPAVQSQSAYAVQSPNVPAVQET